MSDTISAKAAYEEELREEYEDRPQRCANCRFYQPRYTDSEGGYALQLKALDKFEPMGECHRFPPTIRKLDKEPTWFPEVMMYYWCGEWQAKPEPLPTSDASSSEPAS